MKQIMKLMTSDEMKMKAELIFQRINALPPSKRMSVLPGIHYPESPVVRYRLGWVRLFFMAFSVVFPTLHTSFESHRSERTYNVYYSLLK